VGSVMGDLSLRHGQIQAIEHQAGTPVIRALVPLARMIGYATALRSCTQGRGSYSSQFAMYERAADRPEGDDNRIGVTANRPWKPRPRQGAEAAQPPSPSGSDFWWNP